MPSQVNRFIDDLNKTPSQLNSTDKDLARKLISLHHPKNPFQSLPSYNEELLQKGVYCNKCYSYLMSIKKHDFVCGNCGEHEKIKKAIFRHAIEFQLLLPDQKITTNNIYKWCNANINKKTVCRVLKENFTAVGKTKETYYK